MVDTWGPIVVSRGVVHSLQDLPMLLAVDDGEIVGALAYRQVGTRTEIVTLESFRQRQGVGSFLLRAAIDRFGSIWLVTTNDNLPAQALYASLHGQLVSIHKGAVAAARVLKPGIPLRGTADVPIEDELVFAWGLNAV